ncbi:MAG: hypothetical protein NC548_31770 [Lachnospiraceae bacterium]|nr:hypothetical protein [Lachnospiraceae bacterium]
MSRAKTALTNVLNIVSEETDVAVSEIMGKYGETETVDARWICVKLLRNLGYYPMRIGELMHITPRYVQYILTDFEDRIDLNTVMRNDYERAKKRLRNLCEII